MAGDGPTYPMNREAFFAMRVVRLLVKAAVANEIGPEAALLVTVIAATEDSRRYKSPVTFFNEQLMPLVGVATWRRLDAIRQKAVASGWLAYVPAPEGSKLAGKYWSMIPMAHQDRQDGPADEGETPVVVSLDMPDVMPDDLQNSISTSLTSDITSDITSSLTSGITILPIPIPLGGKETRDEKPDYVAPKGFCVNPAVTAVEINGTLVEYHEDSLRWETEFVRQWNRTPGVSQRNSGDIDQPMRKALQSRLCDPQWFWKRALAAFPLKVDSDWIPNLSWFLKPDSVSKILDGSFKPIVKARQNGKRNGADNRGSTYDPMAAAGTSVDGWGKD